MHCFTIVLREAVPCLFPLSFTYCLHYLSNKCPSSVLSKNLPAIMFLEQCLVVSLSKRMTPIQINWVIQINNNGGFCYLLTRNLNSSGLGDFSEGKGAPIFSFLSSLRKLQQITIPLPSGPENEGSKVVYPHSELQRWLWYKTWNFRGFRYLQNSTGLLLYTKSYQTTNLIRAFNVLAQEGTKN